MENMFNASKLYERYEKDNEFYKLVQVMEAYIYQNGYDPSELRQAAFFAAYKYQMNHPLHRIAALTGQTPLHQIKED
jgi:hypothetical protein